MLLIGSVALEKFGVTRGARDIDLIATFDELNQLTKQLREIKTIKVLSIPYSRNKTVLKVNSEVDAYTTHVEVEIAWPGSTGEELLTREDTFFGTSTLSLSSVCLLQQTKVAPLDVLYTLKMSHRYLKNSVHFEKTMNDIRRMRRLGAKIFDEEWLKRREKETYTYEHPNLNTTKNKFFKMNEGVHYIYDHDSIHLAMAHMSKANRGMWKRSKIGQIGDAIPAYKLYAGEGEVISSKKKFFELSEATRFYGVLEEAQVLALERSQIPYGVVSQYAIGSEVDRIRRLHGIEPSKEPPSPLRSFELALKKVCTSITSGWFREFAWENYYTIQSMYEPDYVDRFWAAVERGTVFRTPFSLEKEINDVGRSNGGTSKPATESV